MANRKPLQYPRYQAWANDETFLNGGTITFYDAGTTNKRNVYQDAALTTTAPNPVTLNSRGEPQSAGGTAIDIYLDNQAYKIVLADSTGTTKHTIDNYIETQDVLEPKDPADATDQSTDVFEGTLNSDPASGETFQVDFQTANTTTTPTFENTSGSFGAKTIKTRDGSALWSGALNGVHELQYDGTDYLLLDPALNSGGEYAASMDQGVATTDSPTFSNVTGSDTNFVTGTAGTDGNLAQWNADGDAVDGPDVLDEDNMASDSASAVPTQQSVKAYADTVPLQKPGTSSNPALAFDTWRTPNANRPTLVIVETQVETDGTSNGSADVQVDEGGGTTPDYGIRNAFVDKDSGSSVVVVFALTFVVPAGGSYNIKNVSDPNNANAINEHREFTL